MLAEKKIRRTSPYSPSITLRCRMFSNTIEGCFDKLMDSPQMNNIAEFWWGYILKECDNYVSRRMNELHGPALRKPQMKSCGSVRWQSSLTIGTASVPQL